jgi:hypothetical protein
VHGNGCSSGIGKCLEQLQNRRVPGFHPGYGPAVAGDPGFGGFFRSLLACRPLLDRERALASGRTTCSAAQGANVDFQFGDGATQRVAMHSQLARSLTLISMILFQHGNDEPLLELAYSLAIEDSAFVHLHHERFQLVLHDTPRFPDNEQFQLRRLLTSANSTASGCYF